MPEGTGIGVYPYGEVGYARENDEVSSTYEGRHLTVLASEITSHDPAHALQQKGHPLVVGENIVGVAFVTEVAATDPIAFDTEGIWLLSVVATDQDGNNAVVAGDELFINKSTAIISKNANKVTHCHFGYALGGVNTGQTAIISVKVHWDPDDEYELVGQDAAPSVSIDVGHRFREYHYEAQGGGYPKGDYLKLTISTASCNSAQALRRVLAWTADGNWVTGYAAVGEFDLEIATGDAGMDTTCVIMLTANCLFPGTGHNNFQFSWIRIQEYSAVEGSRINSLFEINDNGATYPLANDLTSLFVASSGDLVTTHTLRFVVNAVPYYIQCRTAN